MDPWTVNQKNVINAAKEFPPAGWKTNTSFVAYNTAGIETGKGATGALERKNPCTRQRHHFHPGPLLFHFNSALGSNGVRRPAYQKSYSWEFRDDRFTLFLK